MWLLLYWTTQNSQHSNFTDGMEIVKNVMVKTCQTSQNKVVEEELFRELEVPWCPVQCHCHLGFFLNSSSAKDRRYAVFYSVTQTRLWQYQSGASISEHYSLLYSKYWCVRLWWVPSLLKSRKEATEFEGRQLSLSLQSQQVLRSWEQIE